MAHSRLSALGLVLAVFLCFQTTRAQQTNPPDNDRKAAEAALREKAFKLLDSLADQLGSLQSAENRARIGSNIADSIWPHDEERARNLFRYVAEDIKLGLQQSKDERYPSHTFAVFQKLREDNVERIAKHDPELALTFLKDTFPLIQEAMQRPDGETSQEILRQEHALELRLAQKIGPKNVEVSVRLARQALEKGFDDQLLMILIRLSDKNREQAQSLYKDIVRKLAEDDFSQYYWTANFATQLVRNFRPPAADEATYRELLGVLLNKAIAKGCDRETAEDDNERQTICGSIGGLVPLIEKFYPGQARRLRRWAPEGEQYTQDNFTQAYAELNDLYVNGTVDEILSLQSKYPALSGEILIRAINRAEKEGDLERAQKIASSYTGDDVDTQHALKHRLEFYSMSEEKLEAEWNKTEKSIDNLPPAERANELVTGGIIISVISKKMALKILDRASGMVEMLSPGEKQTHFQIQLALGYCLVKDDRGFAIMESLLPKLNELVAAAVKLDGYDTQYLRDGEWNMSAAGSTGNLLTELAGGAGYFAWFDFDRAVSLAGQFDRIEIRMMAQLKLAQGILDGPPKPLATTRGW
jgi:hypothetical protein